MSTPAKCPLCGTKLQPDWQDCPNCPMSFTDAPPQKTVLEGDTFSNFGPPLILFGGLAFVIWAFGSYMWRTGEANNTPASPLVNKAPLAPVRPPPPSFLSPVFPVFPVEPKTPERAEEGEGIVSISPLPPSRKKRRVVEEWRMRGVVYDLITLKPVPGVHLIFMDYRTNSRAEIQVDAQGRYRVVLPPLTGRGYRVTVSMPGYAKSYLDPRRDGVAEMPLERRQELGKDLSSLIFEPASLQPDSDAPLLTDFYIAPN